MEYEIGKNKELLGKINSMLETPYTGKVRLRSFLDIFSKPETMAEIKKRVRRPLTGLKVACYYGCLFVKPPKVVDFFDNPENPMSMDNLMSAIGAEPLPWPYKTECCGASLAMTQEDVCTKLCNDILKVAKDSGRTASWPPARCASRTWTCARSRWRRSTVSGTGCRSRSLPN